MSRPSHTPRWIRVAELILAILLILSILSMLYSYVIGSVALGVASTLTNLTVAVLAYNLPV